MSQAIIETNNLSIHFSGLAALDDFNFSLYPGELVGLIGPNGAGKTTAFNLLTGVYEATAGTYRLNGKEVKKTRPHKLVKEGLARTFQNIRLFGYLSVLDNVLIAKNDQMTYGPIAGALRLPKYWQEEAKAKAEAMELLKLFDLDSMAHYRANTLPYGSQRKLEIVRALATKPKVLLLDEPAAGMNPNETASLMETIKMVRDKFNITILLIEHDMKLVLGICERLIVLNQGKTIAQGKPLEVVNNPDVIRAYLGDEGFVEA